MEKDKQRVYYLFFLRKEYRPKKKIRMLVRDTVFGECGDMEVDEI